MKEEEVRGRELGWGFRREDVVIGGRFCRKLVVVRVVVLGFSF